MVIAFSRLVPLFFGRAGHKEKERATDACRRLGVGRTMGEVEWPLLSEIYQGHLLEGLLVAVECFLPRNERVDL